MGLVETEALVLKSYSLSDADKIVVFLTRDHGLVRGVAKGAKRLKSHFGSALEPCSVVKLSYFQKEHQELASIRQSELISSSFERVSDPLYLQRFSYMAELLNDFSPPGEPNERLFKMTRACLDAPISTPEALDQITLYFESWLLNLGGYLPDWSKCAECGREVPLGEEASLDTSCRIACRNCQQVRGSWTVTAGERGVYDAVKRMSPARFIEATSGSLEEVRSVSGALRRIISGVLGRDRHEDRILSASYR